MLFAFLIVGFHAPMTPPLTPSRAAASMVDAEVVTAATAPFLNGADPLLLGGGAVVALGGLAFASTQSDTSPPAPAPPQPVPTPKPKRVSRPRFGNKWPMKGGTNKPKPKKPPRELWKPPPDWEPPRKPVQSWYDCGERLTPAEPVEPARTNIFKSVSTLFSGGLPSTWPLAGASPAGASWGIGGKRGLRGGTNKLGSHRMSAKAKAPPREAWKPPPGWTPPKKISGSAVRFPFEDMVIAKLPFLTAAEALEFLDRHSTRYYLSEAGVNGAEIAEARAIVAAAVKGKRKAPWA
jgi:hypothetical protein